MQGLPTKLFTIGWILLFGTISLFRMIIPGAMNWKIKQMLRFEEGNKLYEEFTNIKAKILFKVYLYNVTNSEDIAAGKRLPKLEEIGPYVYEEKRWNIPVKLDAENDTFTYQTLINFHFRRDLSSGSDEDVITMLNVPIVAIAHELNNWPGFIRQLAKEYVEMYHLPLFVARKVKTALFDGVYLEIAESMSNLLGVEYLPNNTFGYFTDKNATLSKKIEIKAGITETSQIGNIISFDNKKSLSIWGGESCNMINGSDGSIYPPFITKESILRGFNGDICRSAYMTFKGEEQVEGISGYRFEFPQDFFNAGISYNECFCGEDEKEKCPRSGALSVGPCKFGAPLLISNPHFLHGDPYYEEMTGLGVGDREKHEPYIVLEPNTGVILKSAARMQLNVDMRKSKDIKQLQNVQDTIFPLFWVDEVAAHPENTYQDLWWGLALPLKIMETGKWAMLGISLVMMIAGCMIFIVRVNNKKWLAYY